MTIAQKLLSLYALLLILFSLALVASFMHTFRNYYNLIKNDIRIKINILFSHILVLVLLGFGEFLISFFIV